ncbi:FAD-binding oxidoreductase [Spirulina sp. CS-785/01]|uniref:FAD-binding oxidoreductase n=1 Tax=Spirulina sp. CS-785/01 TaxID=3021716 RepID=UPI00232D4D34|nr:FAD-binding oxidoreductase [Spirulina sp. CS-785/01]MDB9313761.1 FAD-binding oxidoreductase [Spirulina sp. CS-785/01]
MTQQQVIANWGNYPQLSAEVDELGLLPDVQNYLQQQSPLTLRGNGRSYGDASLGKQVFSTLKLNKFLDLNTESGILTCQGGVLLSEILDVILPQGLFLPVTPGTKFITVGGAIASDVHGKNHHKEGSFSRHVLSFDLMLADGTILTCSRQENQELFWLTMGGMGLTGLILSATFLLKKIETAYIRQTCIKARNLAEIMDLFESSTDWTYSVAWIDCLATGEKQGRSLLLLGEHATLEDVSPNQKANPLEIPQKRKLNIPFYFPRFALNGLTVKAFNTLYYNKQWAKESQSLISYDPFFYPLDSIYNWNRIYGKPGFVQYQFVLPKETSKDGLSEILTTISQSGQGSFLAVLKLFGKGEPEAWLSFPMEGYTLALDFKVQPKVFELLEQLDRLVLKYGGRLYLTKDARMKKEALQNYPHLEQFKQSLPPGFTSHLAERLELTINNKQ